MVLYAVFDNVSLIDFKCGSSSTLNVISGFLGTSEFVLLIDDDDALAGAVDGFVVVDDSFDWAVVEPLTIFFSMEEDTLAREVDVLLTSDTGGRTVIDDDPLIFDSGGDTVMLFTIDIGTIGTRIGCCSRDSGISPVL